MTKCDLAVRNARIHTVDDNTPWAEALAVKDGRICWIGDDADAPDAEEVVDAGGQAVLPGFVDGHAHVLMAGEAQLRAHLTDAADLPEIQRRVQAWAEDNPDAPRVLGRGWLFSAVPDGRPTRQMLDAVVPHRPVYLDANAYHTVWVNSKALEAVG
jgi:predicted amidohydrolase YtcJ